MRATLSAGGDLIGCVDNFDRMKRTVMVCGKTESALPFWEVARADKGHPEALNRLADRQGGRAGRRLPTGRHVMT